MPQTRLELDDVLLVSTAILVGAAIGTCIALAVLACLGYFPA